MPGLQKGRANIRKMSWPWFAFTEIVGAIGIAIVILRLTSGEVTAMVFLDVALIVFLVGTSIYFWLVRSGRWQERSGGGSVPN